MISQSLTLRFVGHHGVLAAVVWLLVQNLVAGAFTDDLDIVLVKIGGSSITHKAQRENLNQGALDWFAQSIFHSLSSSFLAVVPEDDEKCRDGNQTNRAFVVVHGAGSFGHFSANNYQLQGQSELPTNVTLSSHQNRFRMRGVAETRLSVQTLNRLVVQSLVEHTVNEIGISPCFGIPGLQAHASQQMDPISHLRQVVKETVDAGLVPVLHGDACLYGNDGGILSGGTIMEILGTASWVDHSVFITDVDGVFSEDPRTCPSATLLRYIAVDPETGRITTQLVASSSTHDHDVTGGLETKIRSAATIASSGKNVVIVKCQSSSAEQALRLDPVIETASIVTLTTTNE